MSTADAPASFLAALRSLGAAPTRTDVRLVEVPAPSRIAPFAAAINGTVLPEERDTTGRFVFLHDPEGHPAWDGDMRIIALVKARVEPEIGMDDMWADAAWSWISDALAGVSPRQLGGTVTKVINRSFGQLAEREDDVSVEMRVSWTPTSPDLTGHVVAWTELMALCAGIPPAPEGVAVLPGGRA